MRNSIWYIYIKNYISKVFNIIRNFFNRSSRSDDARKISEREILNEKIFASIDDFKNRPIYNILTKEIIDNTSDDELMQVVFDNLSTKFPNDRKKQYSTVVEFSKGRQAFFVIWCLKGEVDNGGFNQFYFNSSKRYAPMAPGALIEIGATNFAELVDKANHIFVEQHEKITQYQDGTLEGFSKSYEDNPLTPLDNEFYLLDKNNELEKMQIQYIRKNKSEFIDE